MNQQIRLLRQVATRTALAGILTVNLVSASPSFAAAASGGDWPGWRGAARNGISSESGLNWSWPVEGPKVLWRASVGKGFSSFAVVDGRAYTMGNREDQDTVYCLDAQTGKEIWKYSYACPLNPLSYEGGPSSTPAVDNGKVYTVSKSGDVHGLDAGTGKVVWSKQLETPPTTKEDYRVWWGYAGSPLVLDNQVIITAGTAGLALDKTTGNMIWQSGPGRPGYSSPVPFSLGTTQGFALLVGHEVVAVDAGGGKELWRFPWRTTWDQNAADVVVAEGKLLVSTGHGVGGAQYDFSGGKPVEVWRSKNLRSELASPVLWREHLYGFDAKRLICLEWKTGEVKWAAEESGQGSLILADGKLIALQENGLLRIVEASDAALKPVAQAQVLKGRCWTAPALAGGKLFVRSAVGDVVCLDVR